MLRPLLICLDSAFPRSQLPLFQTSLLFCNRHTLDGTQLVRYNSQLLTAIHHPRSLQCLLTTSPHALLPFPHASLAEAPPLTLMPSLAFPIVPAMYTAPSHLPRFSYLSPPCLSGSRVPYPTLTQPSPPRLTGDERPLHWLPARPQPTRHCVAPRAGSWRAKA